VLQKILRGAKAVTAGLAAGATAFATAIQDNDVTGAEWVTVAVAAVLAGIAVWSVPNRAPDAPALD